MLSTLGLTYGLVWKNNNSNDTNQSLIYARTGAHTLHQQLRNYYSNTINMLYEIDRLNGADDDDDVQMFALILMTIYNSFQEWRAT